MKIGIKSRANTTLQLIFASGISLWFGILILGGTAQALPANAHFEETAKSFLKQRLSEQFQGQILVEIKPLSLQINRPTCTNHYDIFLSKASPGSHMTVGFQCKQSPSGSGETFFVQAIVQLIKPIIITTRAIPSGVQIQPSDIKLEKRDTLVLKQGFYDAKAEVIGQFTYKTLAANTPLTPGALKPTILKKSRKRTLQIIAKLP